jgi:crossover junction endonuclease MUS81
MTSTTAPNSNNSNNNNNNNNNKLRLLTEFTFEQFNERVSKTRNLSVSDVFAKQLLRIRGVSAEKAAAIVRVYPTPRTLIRAYDETTQEKERNELLCDIKFGKEQRRLGQTLSARIALFYNDFSNGNTPLLTKNGGTTS